MTPIDLSSFLVLNVDDDAPSRYVKSRLLRSHGLRVLEAATGREGLDMVRAHSPDLVLLDTRLPDLSGIDVCGFIKGNPGTAKTLVLQTSAVAIATVDRIRALNAGADSYLVEPAEAEEILAIVKALLRLRKAERELEVAKREAERANAAKSHFLAAASHDLRQPLQAQRLFLTLLEGKLSTPEQRDLAVRLSDSLQATECLLHTLMDLSALDSGRVSVEIQDVNLAEIVAGVVADHEPEAIAKGLRLRSHLRPLWIRTDPVLLQRMVRNLVSNAVRYTEAGGLLVADRLQDGQAVCEVWDTGVGIPPDEHDRIFTDFYQLTNGERDRRKGLGIGLAVVSRTAELLSHRVLLRSQPGRGSVFKLQLGPPVVPADAEDDEVALVDDGPAGHTVLLVEDDALQLAGLSMFLEDWGYSVVEAGDATAALDRLAEGARPELVITDLRLPGMTGGLALLGRIREQMGAIPAIVQTGDTDPKLVSSVETDASIRILHKPYSPDRLRQVVGELLGPFPAPPGRAAGAPRGAGAGPSSWGIGE